MSDGSGAGGGDDDKTTNDASAVCRVWVQVAIRVDPIEYKKSNMRTRGKSVTEWEKGGGDCLWSNVNIQTNLELSRRQSAGRAGKQCARKKTNVPF